MSPPPVAFLDMQRLSSLYPGGGSVDFQVYRFRASATGRSVLTLLFSDGSAALQDTIEVGPTIPRGTFAQVSTGFLLKTCAVAAKV